MNLDRARGVLLGQACGDALGATLEFLDADTIARRYPGGLREIVGGGPFGIAAGQVTDDTELAVVLARSLASKRRFDAHDVLSGYRAWAGGGPVDIGNTCRDAFVHDRPNPHSQANGALMRASPLGVWGAGRSGLDEAAADDCRLSHPHPACVAANVAYVRAIAALLGGATPAEAHAAALDAARGTPVAPWLASARTAPPDDYETHLGWVAIALQNAFFQLLHAPDPEAGIVDSARRGGDTDTNAAIAGALLGAAHGAEAIPARWRQAVLAHVPDLEDLALRLVRPTVAVADVHGHGALLRALLARLDAELGAYDLVLLGDLVDNGPDVPDLLDTVIALQARGAVAIAGNHDVACLRALHDDGAWAAWAETWAPGRGTPAQYGAHDPAAFRARFPPAHRALLASLPWVYDDGAHVFVHAGLVPGPLAPQVAALQRHDDAAALSDKTRSVLHDPAWDRVVVSGHTRRLERFAPDHAALPHFATATRLTLSAEVDLTGTLWAVVLPERRFVAAT